MRRFTKYDLLGIVVLWVILTLLFLPRILHAAWMFTDDGVFLESLKETSLKMKAGDPRPLVKEFALSGRFVPASIATFLVRYWIGGTDPQLYVIFQYALVLISCVGLFLSVRIITQSTPASLVGGIVFALFSPNWENFYRLYPPELLLTTALALFALALVTLVEFDHKGQRSVLLVGFAFISFAYAMFVKETSVAVFLPILLSAIVVKLVPVMPENFAERLRENLKKISVGFLCIIACWWIARKIGDVASLQSGWYTAGYQIQGYRVFTSFGKYLDVLWNGGGPFVYCFGIVAVIFLISSFRKKSLASSHFWILFFLSWLGSFLAVLLPWKFALGRYLTPGIWAYAVVVGIAWNELWISLLQYGRAWRFAANIILLLFSLIFLITNVMRINHMINWMETRDSANRELLETLSNIPGASERHLWFVYPEQVETYAQINSLLKELYNVRFAYVGRLNDDKINSSLQRGDLVVIPGMAGDGHFSCDGSSNRRYEDNLTPEIESRSNLLKNIDYKKESSTVYLDSPVYNAIKEKGIALPGEIIGKRGKRNFIDGQMLEQSWTLYEVIN